MARKTSTPVGPVLPQTCDAYFALHGENGSAGCARLPRHAGECRAYLKMTDLHKAQRAAAKAKAKASPKVTTRAGMLDAAKAYKAGTLAASTFMSLVSAFGQRRAKAALATVPSRKVAAVS